MQMHANKSKNLFVSLPRVIHKVLIFVLTIDHKIMSEVMQVNTTQLLTIPAVVA